MAGRVGKAGGDDLRSSHRPGAQMMASRKGREVREAGQTSEAEGCAISDKRRSAGHKMSRKN